MENITRVVKEFYTVLPFNYGSVINRAKAIQHINPISAYGQLGGVIEGSSKIIDVGTGVGWFVNAVAYYYSKVVLGIDLSDKALGRAKQISEYLGVDSLTKFRVDNIFERSPLKQYDLVNTIGVLHHTYDCKLAFDVVASWVKKGGYLHIGLYHQYGRRPFLNLFENVRTKIDKNIGITTKEYSDAYKRYKDLNKQVQDEDFLTSWFRDQVLHPHETQHTLKEVVSWADNCGFQLIETSINRFNPINSFDALYDAEKDYEQLSIDRNINQGVYFPGFFTCLFKKINNSG